MEILKTPLTDSYFITLFEGGKYSTYGISKEGTVIENKVSIETNFYNRRENFSGYKMYGKLSKMTEDDAVTILESAGLESPYINYVDRTQTFDSALESLMSFVVSEDWDKDIDKTWLIIPKPSKQLKGKKMLMEFEVGAEDFSCGSRKMELEVFMTPITKLSKSVSFSMKIPKFLYDKCMTDSDIGARPIKNYIECDTISSLHTQISNYVGQAHKIWGLDKDSEDSKKIICINFNSAEKSTRDDLNHGYTGQQISTTFNFYVAYQTSGKNELSGRKKMFTFKKLQHGMGSMEKGIKGIIDSELQGGKNFIMDRPIVIIDWTQEREDFLTRLEEQFRTLSANLNSFLKDLDNDKIELLIQNNEFLKLN